MASWLADWSTYELSNFLLFSPRTYHRLFEIYNRALGSGLIGATALGPLFAGLLVLDPARFRRAAGCLLGAAWLWVAFAFHLERYATIQWVAPWFAVAFALQGLLLFGASLSRQPTRPPMRFGVAHGLVILGAVVQPLIGPMLLERSWWQIELFGLAPDPTAVATLGGVLLLERGWRRNLLLIVPLAWCAVAGLTLRAMAAPDFWVAPLAALITLSAAALGEARDRVKVQLRR